MTIRTQIKTVISPLFGQVSHTTAVSTMMLLVVVGVLQLLTEMENISIENGVFVPKLAQVNNNRSKVPRDYEPVHQDRRGKKVTIYFPMHQFHK